VENGSRAEGYIRRTYLALVMKLCFVTHLFPKLRFAILVRDAQSLPSQRSPARSLYHFDVR